MPDMKRIALAVLVLCGIASAADLKLGIIGTDTSHVIAFIKTLNDPASKDYVPGAKIVAAYKGGSPDLDSSWSRVDQYAEELKTKWNVEIVPDIPTLCSKVDGILLESVDGRPHLAQARQVIAAKKPMFIDKPLSATLEDAREIARLAKEAGVPWFTSSSLRWSSIVSSVRASDAIAVTTWGPGPMNDKHYLDLAWYAIHPIEVLYTLMGTGCVEVTRIASTGETGHDVIVGRWKDGRTGTVYALRPYGPYGATVIRRKAVLQSPEKYSVSYNDMLKEIVKFFQTGQPPVPNEESLELFAFMDAAQRSKEADGKPMKLR